MFLSLSVKKIKKFSVLFVHISKRRKKTIEARYRKGVVTIGQSEGGDVITPPTNQR